MTNKETRGGRQLLILTRGWSLEARESGEGLEVFEVVVVQKKNTDRSIRWDPGSQINSWNIWLQIFAAVPLLVENDSSESLCHTYENMCDSDYEVSFYGDNDSDIDTFDSDAYYQWVWICAFLITFFIFVCEVNKEYSKYVMV